MNISGFVDGLVAKSRDSIHRNPEDYEKDGILYCGKCNTPKQIELTLPWGTAKPYCMCKCMEEENERKERERKEEERRFKVERMRKDCFQNGRMMEWTFAHDNGDNLYISNAAHKYADNFQTMLKQGKGLLFFGEVGRGKTFTAACIANEIINKGFSCYMTNFSTLANTIFSMYDKQEYINSLNKYSLLIIDDLASERKNEYMNEIVYNVIDARYRAGRPIIVTTNLSAEEIKNPTDLDRARILSRLMEMCIPVEVKGKDKRKKELIQNFADYKDMLGL